MNNLNTRAWLGLILTTIGIGGFLFVSAGTLRYWQAWSYLGVFFVASTLVTLYLMKHDPALLERRLSAGPTAEKEKAQKTVMLFASIGFIGLLVVAGLDHRFGWSAAPPAGVIAADLVTLVGYFIIFLVYRENSFTSATIEIAPGQRVISTGPYAVVRHPMYAGGSLYLVAMPLGLGSYWGLVVLLAMLPVLVWRLVDEENFLSKNLQGYDEYRAKVRWRLIPRVF